MRNGLKIQWGYKTVNSSGYNTEIDFPLVFTVPPFVSDTLFYNGNGHWTTMYEVREITKTHVSFYNYSNSQNGKFYYIAIGY